MNWFDLLNTQDPGTFDLTDPRAEETGYGFDAVNLAPGEGNLEQDFVVNEKGQVVDSAGNLGRFVDGKWAPIADPKTSPGGNWLSKLINTAKTAGGKALDFAGTNQGLMAILAALASYADRQRPSGGGVGTAYAGYKPLQRTMQGNIARYAAQGGIMHAYAQGGAVRPFPMQDGGFVLTKRAVDGAGGPQGMRQHVPEAVPIRGPGHGTSDSIPAYIQGPHGRTPAKVSNGEMYVPPGRDTRGLYALMRAMERKA